MTLKKKIFISEDPDKTSFITTQPIAIASYCLNIQLFYVEDY